MGNTSLTNTPPRLRERITPPKPHYLKAYLTLFLIIIFSVVYWVNEASKDRNDKLPDDSPNFDTAASLNLFDSGLFILILGAIVIIGIFMVLNTEQIKSWAYRYVIPNKGMHRLSMQEIFENL